MYRKIKLMLVSAVMLCISFAYATEATSGSDEIENKQIEVVNIWASKPLSPNNNSAAYMTINNPTNKDVTIIEATAPNISGNVELHQSFVDENGISRMTSIDKIVVPAGSAVELAQGGIHIMLFDLIQSITVGDTFEIEMKTECSALPIIVEAVVK